VVSTDGTAHRGQCPPEQRGAPSDVRHGSRIEVAQGPRVRASAFPLPLAAPEHAAEPVGQRLTRVIVGDGVVHGVLVGQREPGRLVRRQGGADMSAEDLADLVGVDEPKAVEVFTTMPSNTSTSSTSSTASTVPNS
jgi:hypothetical protein